MTVHPLTAFACWRWDAPFVAEPPRFGWRAVVTPVRPKVPYVAPRRSGLAHRHNGVAAIISGAGTAQFGARFLCGGYSHDIAVLPNADAHVTCAICEDAAEGPCAYWCFGADAGLIYIGSAECWLKRRKGHESRTAWWHEVADVKVRRFPTIFEARAIERKAILAERPPRNILPGSRSRHRPAPAAADAI